MQCAYNYFDAPGRIKRMTAVQPFITAGETIIPSISVDVDFRIQTQNAPVQILNGGALWDVAIWDTSTWFGSVIQTTDWLSAQAMGHALAVHLVVNAATPALGQPPAIFDFSLFDQAQFDVGFDSTATILRVNAFNAILEQGGFI